MSLDLKLEKFTNVPVAKTASYIAAARAFESRRSTDRFFFDPYAEDFGSGFGESFMRHFEQFRSFLKVIKMEDEILEIDENWGNASSALAVAVNSVTVRTKFFDTMTLKEKVPQVVILACGYDTRGLRLPLSEDVTVFELDFPEVIEHREKVFSRPPVYIQKANDPTLGDDKGLDQVIREQYTLRSYEMLSNDSPLAPHPLEISQETWKELGEVAKQTLENAKAKRIPVPCDLREVPLWKKSLLDKGFNPELPSVWLVEGLTMYLTEEQNDNLFLAISSYSAPGSRIILDLMSPFMIESRYTKSFVDKWAEWGAPLIFGVKEPISFISKYGYKADFVTTYGAKDAEFRKKQGLLSNIISKIQDVNPAKNYLVTAVRTDQNSNELSQNLAKVKLIDKARKEINALSNWVLPEKIQAINDLLNYLESKDIESIMSEHASSILSDLD